MQKGPHQFVQPVVKISFFLILILKKMLSTFGLFLKLTIDFHAQTLPLSLILHAAAAKSLQSCPTLCDHIDGSPPGSPVPGILRQEHQSGLPFPSPMHESEKSK